MTDMPEPQVDEAGTRGARTAARLRAAAREAFAEHGWEATRVKDIVGRAGVSHGTFYTYYDNKVAVLAALVRDSQAAFAALAAAPWEADDVRGALERVIGGFLQRYRDDAPIMRTWLHAAREDAAFGRLYVELRALFIDRVADNVAAVVAASGRGDGPPAQTVASALLAMVEHFAYVWLVLGEEHDEAEVVASLVLVWGSTLNALAGFPVVDLD